jgi:hypothetical protein
MLQSLILNRPFARLRAVAWVAICEFSSRGSIHSVNLDIRDDEKRKNGISANFGVGQSGVSELSAPKQHLIQFQLSPSSSTRLDVAIVSHFRIPDTSKSENAPSLTSAHRLKPAPAAPADQCSTASVHEAALSVAILSKGRPPRGRQGRQQHSANAVPARHVPPLSPSPSLKSSIEISRRKLYELRRTERQRFSEAECSPNSAPDSNLNGAISEDFAADDDEEFAQSSQTSLPVISVNQDDFEYHMNVTATLASRERVSQLIESGMVSLNGSPVSSKSHLLAEGNHSLAVTLPFGTNRPKVSNRSACPFPVLYEDDTILVICKPPGIVVHPTSSVHDACTPSVVSTLLEHGFSLPASQAAIHRFDDTSQFLLVSNLFAALWHALTFFLQSRACSSLGSRHLWLSSHSQDSPCTRISQQAIC